VPLTTSTDLSPTTSGLSFEPAPNGLRLVDCLPGQLTLASQIDSMLRENGNEPVLIAVRRIFNDLVRFIDCLHLMESNLHQSRETLEILQLIHIDTLALLDYTEMHALQLDGVEEKLYEVLDGMSFALRHELRRVFEEILGDSSPNEPIEVTQAKFTDAHRVLTNCLQQSIITLAQVFDPRLDGRQLFNNSKARLKQSLMLLKDLWTMINVVKRAQRNWNDDSMNAVLDHIQAFRNGSMHYLMYRDWGHFDRLAADLDRMMHDPVECELLLHQFLCYLETLLGQVKLRGVLAELMPNVFCNEDEGEDAELDWTTDEIRLAFELYMAA
jgi:hypothetical protein